MPELPEVQTIVNDLNEKIIGERIVDFWSDWKKRVRPNFSKFKREINGAKIMGVRRIGKQIIIDLDPPATARHKRASNKKSILIHLKMTGYLLFKPVAGSLKPVARRNFVSAKISSPSSLRVRSTKQSRLFEAKPNHYFEEKVNQYIHHIITFKSGNTLKFSDLRKFGWLSVVQTSEVENQKEIQQLGVDAMSRSFTLKKFKEILHKKPKSVIGTLLLDQHQIAGIGNIYRSEILFSAKVYPERKVYTLTETEIKEIFKFTKSILKRAIKMRGTSDSDYRDAEGKPGNFQKVLNVYRREKQKCKKCKTNLIKRKKLGQRSFFYCSKCQK